MRINEELNRLCTLLMGESWHPEDAVTAPKKMSVVDVKEYLEQNYSSRITLDELSRAFYINKYYLTRVFKEQYGMSITSYLYSSLSAKGTDEVMKPGCHFALDNKFAILLV